MRRLSFALQPWCLLILTACLSSSPQTLPGDPSQADAAQPDTQPDAAQPDTQPDAAPSGTMDGGSGQDQRSGSSMDLPPPPDLAPLRTQVLVFRGRSGSPPSGDYYRYVKLTAEYVSAGLTVNETTLWPSDLSLYRLLILSVPGQKNDTDFFSATEVAAMKNFLDSGGTLYIANDWSGFQGTAVIRDLLGKLGSSLSTTTASISGSPASPVGIHPLVASLKALSYAYSSSVSAGTGVNLATSGGEVIMAAGSYGAGTIVVAGDGQFIDDHGLSRAVSEAADNLTFVRRLAGL